MIWRRAITWVTLLLLCVASGCGGREKPPVAPAGVPTALVPPKLQGGSLAVAEDEKSRDVFKSPGRAGLFADGRVYVIRGKGDRLVGTLQILTVRADVDLHQEKARRQVVEGILTTGDKISVGGVEISQASTEDKSVYVWFGDGIYQVLQLKPNRAVPFEPEQVLNELVSYEVAQPEWKPLRVADDLDPQAGEQEDEG